MSKLSNPLCQHSLKPYQATESNAQQYIWACGISAAILIVTFVLWATDSIPAAVALMGVALTLPRWLINVHELFHIYPAERSPVWIRFCNNSPFPLSGLVLSYSQSQRLHKDHHRSPATPDDPDSYHIRGSWLGIIPRRVVSCFQRIIYGLRRRIISHPFGINVLSEYRRPSHYIAQQRVLMVLSLGLEFQLIRPKMGMF